MCDSCDCSAFAAHLWKVGECRDCHHPLASHSAVEVKKSVKTIMMECPQSPHNNIKKLTSDRLQPFNSPLLTSAVPVSPNVRALQRSSSAVANLSFNKDRPSPALLKHAVSARDLKSTAFQSLDDVTETDEIQRGKIIAELIATERDYCRDLDFLVNQVLSPLLAKALLAKDDITRMFSNIQEIRSVNMALLQYLEQHCSNITTLTVCEIFSKMAPFFKCYSQYCNTHTQSLEVIQARRSDAPQFATFLKGIHPLISGLRIEDYLIKPIQRICKYPLFFNSLIQATGTNSPDLFILKEATKKMQEVAQHVNEFRRIAENMRRVLEIQHTVHNKPFSLVHSSRRFLFEIAALVYTPEREWANRTLYLFNDLIMYVRPPSKFNKKNVYIGHIMLDAVDVSEEENILRMVRHGSEDYLLIQCTLPEDRTKLLNLVKSAVGESVRVKERIESATLRSNTPSPPTAFISFDEKKDSPQILSCVPSLKSSSISSSPGIQFNPFKLGQNDIANRRATLRPTKSKFSFSNMDNELDYTLQYETSASDIRSSRPAL